MNIFTRTANLLEGGETLIGCPSKDEGHFERRMNAMAQMNPSGFRTPKRALKTDAEGNTRGMRKRARLEVAKEKQREEIAKSREAFATRAVE